MPELMFDTQDAVPEAFRSIASEKDGKFAINVVPKAELDDFRNRNVELSRERDSLTSTFGRLKTDLELDVDNLDEFITNYSELRTIKQQVDDGKLVADTSLEDAIKARTDQMKSTYEGELTTVKKSNLTLATENEQLKASLEQTQIDSQMANAINDPNSGALPEATRQILREAREVFKVENGELIPRDSKGQVMYGSDGATPMTPQEFLTELEKSSPFFFKAAQGGGAGGSGGGAGNLTAAQLAAMSPEEKMNYGRRNNLSG